MSASALPFRSARAWPLPALAAWALCWALFIGLGQAGIAPALAGALALALGGALATLGTTRWRSIFIAAGFPLSLVTSGLGDALPGWVWLLPLAALLLLYPRRTWGDAPVFPTPIGALAGLAQVIPLADGARVLDAGCGLGAGLRELRREYPRVQLDGIEWSWPLRLLCGLRRRDARVRRADLWAADWSACDLVYAFQRPETMRRAFDKAMRELRPGAWLVSLEFEVPGVAADGSLTCVDGRRVWLYRAR